MSDNAGLDAIIQQQLTNLLSDPSNLPAEFISALPQIVAQNPVPAQATITPAIIASGVGSSSNTPTRYVGGTTAGAPTSGTYVAGDFVVSHDGHIYVCTATGTPGTWSTWPAQSEITFNFITSLVSVTGTSSATATTIIAGSTQTYTTAPIYVEMFAPVVKSPSSAAGDFTELVLLDGSTVVEGLGAVVTPVASTLQVPFYAQVKLSPSAGSHTFSLAAYVSSTTGTPAVGSRPLFTPGDGPSFIRTRYA